MADLWIALHRGDGTELTGEDAPGYRRCAAPNGPSEAIFPKCPEDWGWVKFASVWTAPEGGRCVTDPPLQPLRPEWVKDNG